MEFIVPIGVIIYIIAAVISAIVQSKLSKLEPSKEISPKRVNVEPSQLEVDPVETMEEKLMDFEPVDSVDETTVEERDWDLEFPTAEKTLNKPVRRRIMEPGGLAHAVIMSEVIREPRSKRPWPIR